MKNTLMTVTMGAALAFSLFTATAADEPKLDPSKLPPASDQKDLTYAKDIKAIFDKSCIKCHGGAKPKGKFNLETLDGALKGGKDGKFIIAGKSDKSVLVYAVAHATADEDGYMPPPKNKANIGPLTKDQVALIRAWVDQGAK